jgi:hypothetical protein
MGALVTRLRVGKNSSLQIHTCKPNSRKNADPSTSLRFAQDDKMFWDCADLGVNVA